MPTFTITDGDALKARVTYTVNQKISSNTATVSFTTLELSSTMMTGTFPVAGYVRVGSSGVISASRSTVCECTLKSGEFAKVTNITKGEYTLSQTPGREATFVARASIQLINRLTGGPLAELEGSCTVTLPPMPCNSIVSVSGGTLGEQTTIRLRKVQSNYTDTVTYTCGGLSGTIARDSTASQLSWTPPPELAAAGPKDTSVAVTVTTTTFSGADRLGSSFAVAYFAIPPSVVPVIRSVTVTDERGLAAAYGTFVQNQSSARVVTEAEGTLGADIESVSVKVGKVTDTGADVQFALPDAGVVPINVTVTDSRGRTADYVTEITVGSYSPPAISLTDAYRCGETGEQLSGGRWGAVRFTGSITPLGGINRPVYTLQLRQLGTSQWQDTVLSGFDGPWQESTAQFAADENKSIEICMVLADDFGSSRSGILIIPTAFTLMDFDSSAKAIGIGKRAENANAVTVGLDMNLLSHKITSLAAPTQNTDAATKAYVDSVDSARKKYVDGLVNRLPGLLASNSGVITSSAVTVKTATWTTLGSYTFTKGYRFSGAVMCRFASNSTGMRRLIITSSGSSTDSLNIGSGTAVAACSSYGFCWVNFSFEGTGQTYYFRAYQNSGSSLDCQCRITHIGIPV